MFLIIAVALLSNACSTVDCPSCKEQKRATKSVKEAKPKWNVALNTKIISKCDEDEIQSIETDLKPVFKPYGGKLKNGKIYWDGMSFKEFLVKSDYYKERPFSKLNGKIVVNQLCGDGTSKTYEIPTSNILEITEKSDPLNPPIPWLIDEPCLCCCRDRDGWWLFDKLELRAMLGYRGSIDTIRYTQANGDVITYPPSLFNTDRGGSNLIFGFELAGLWNLTSNRMYQLGFLTGIWPFDGSIFVPLALHGRINTNQKPDPWGTHCDAWYLYGDLGLALDFQTGAPINENRLFWGLGIGYDIPINCNVDFSIDLGFRQMKLPLPEIECCPDVPDRDRYIYRLSNAAILRFGLTY